MRDDDARDTERALRAANLAIADVKHELHYLAAQVLALIDEVGKRLGAPIETAVETAAAPILERIEAAIEGHGMTGRLQLGTELDKYAVDTSGGPPCAELLPVCQARCCRLPFALTTQDLDEGVIRWDRGQPYRIAHTDGRCSHNDPTGGCTVYAHRPAPCRSYDCRADPRIWIDFDQRIAAPIEALEHDPRPIDPSQLVARARARRVALAAEASALQTPRRRDD